jgi:hypothetical protein
MTDSNFLILSVAVLFGFAIEPISNSGAKRGVFCVR